MEPITTALQLVRGATFADMKSQRVGAILHNGTEIIITGAELDIKKSRWVPVKYKGIEGWVNRAFLEKDC